MSTSLLHPVDLKLARAKAQAQALADAVSTWGATNQSPATRSELRDGRLGFRLIVEGFAQEPPTDEWGLQMGECAHNLRSALDNLAFALARLKSDPPPSPKRIAFPISTDKAQFGKESGRTLEQMDDAAAQLIERLQPFNRDGSAPMGTPESDALFMLQWLNNADKHRVPSVVLVAQVDADHEGSIEYYSDEDAAANNPPDITVWNGPLQKGVVLLEWRTKTPVAKVRGRYSMRCTVAIETNAGHTPLIPFAVGVSYYTALIVDQFRPMFPA
jgi:hypothetical protein